MIVNIVLGQNQTGAQERLLPTQILRHLKSDHADQNRKDHQSARYKKRDNDAARKLRFGDERLRSVFEHGAS